jgi:hypothetical protein
MRPKIFMIVVPRAVERVNAWTPKLRPEGLENGDIG